MNKNHCHYFLLFLRFPKKKKFSLLLWILAELWSFFILQTLNAFFWPFVFWRFGLLSFAAPHIPFERAFLELHNRLKINLITLSIEKQRRDKQLCRKIFPLALEISSPEIIFLLSKWLLLFDKQKFIYHSKELFLNYTTK